MVRTVTIASFLTLLLLSCSPSTRETLKGKWGGRDENGDYMEIWFSENNALSYFQGFDAFVLYTYTLTDETISYEFMESSLPESQPFQNRIAVMDADTLILEYVWPNGAHQYYHYTRLSKETPVIYPTLSGHREEYLSEIMSVQE